LGFTIAVAGKGGSGKTSVVSLIIRYLVRHQLGPILAVDADANANLGESLGLDVTHTVGAILAEFQGDKIKIPAGMTKQNYLEYKLNQVVLESKEIDLITMGRGEGQECYCYPNVILRKFVDSLVDNYAYTVMDNEAGMEHLSRGTTQNIDELVIISNHSVKGIRTVARVKELVSDLGLVVKRQSVLVNMVPNGLDPRLIDELVKLNVEPVTTIPEDEEILKYDLEVRSLLELPATSEAVKAVDKFMSNLLRDK